MFSCVFACISAKSEYRHRLKGYLLHAETSCSRLGSRKTSSILPKTWKLLAYTGMDLLHLPHVAQVITCAFGYAP